jgi:hypothetical protein
MRRRHPTLPADMRGQAVIMTSVYRGKNRHFFLQRGMAL